MALRLYKGRPNVKYYPKTASTALANGDLVQLSSGQLVKATTTSTQHVGVVMRDVVATDADYASTTMLPVMVPNDDTEFLIDVGSGTFVVGDIGEVVDLAAAGTLAADATSHKVCLITGFISSTVAIVKISSNPNYVNAV